MKYTITDQEARKLYDNIQAFRGFKSTTRSKAIPFDADRVRSQFSELHPQTKANYARAIGRENDWRMLLII